MFSFKIYNETIHDLLSGRKEDLELREDPIKGIQISNITMPTVSSATQVLEHLSRGNTNRITEATGVNETSSRSHAVFQVMITRDKSIEGVGNVSVSKLSMIDLAGSERASLTGVRDIRST